MSSFLEQNYLENGTYLGDELVQQMPAPNPAMVPAYSVNQSTGLIQIPFTDIVITKQTALVLAAIAAIGAWYFLIYKKK